MDTVPYVVLVAVVDASQSSRVQAYVRLRCKGVVFHFSVFIPLPAFTRSCICVFDMWSIKCG
jgi:hypothetical protein